MVKSNSNGQRTRPHLLDFLTAATDTLTPLTTDMDMHENYDLRLERNCASGAKKA